MSVARNRSADYVALPPRVLGNATTTKGKAALLALLIELLDQDTEAVPTAPVTPAAPPPAPIASGETEVLCYTAKETSEKLKVSSTKLWRMDKNCLLYTSDAADE